jgi:hypothetical protein
MQRVKDPADPNRCQGNAPDGQCMNLSVEGGEYCLAHGGYFAQMRKERSDRRLYYLTEAYAQGRLTELIKHDPTSFLYDVTATAVLLLEKMRRATQGGDTFVEYYLELNTLKLTVEKIKRSTLKIQQNATVLVNKTALYDLGSVLIHLTQAELGQCEDSDLIISRVSQQLDKLVREASNEEGMPSLEASRPLARVKTFNFKNEADAERIETLRYHDGLMSLYEEIIISVIDLERRWNMVETDTELISACSQLTQGLKTLERLIKSAYEQAQYIGELLTQTALRQVVIQMTEIVSEELKQLPNFEESIDRLRVNLQPYFDSTTPPALPAPDADGN